jgi:SAM-dependent methyltransferase
VLPVVGDGNALPLAGDQYDLVSYAQSFHWTDPDLALAEAFRVLKPGGLFAAWWNRHDTSVPWFARHQERLFAACGWTGHDDESWVADLLAGPRWKRHVATVEIPWTRRVSPVDFGRNIMTKSYVFALGDRAADVVAAEVEELGREHPDGYVDEPFTTYAVMARR